MGEPGVADTLHNAIFPPGEEDAVLREAFGGGRFVELNRGTTTGREVLVLRVTATLHPDTADYRGPDLQRSTERKVSVATLDKAVTERDDNRQYQVYVVNPAVGTSGGTEGKHTQRRESSTTRLGGITTEGGTGAVQSQGQYRIALFRRAEHGELIRLVSGKASTATTAHGYQRG